MTIENRAQFEAWNGAEGAAWAAKPMPEADHDADLHRLLLDAARVTERDRVLEIGCGAGDLTRQVARRAPAGQVTGADLSGPMLDRARRDAAAAGIGNVVFEQADVQVHPFPAGGFDTAVSKYGVMFFADPVAAFTNIRAALRPGGRLAFVCPQPPEDCGWYVIPVAALLGVPPRPRAVVDAYPGPAPAMFSLSDRDRLGEVLAAAGLIDVSVAPVHLPLRFGQDAAEAAGVFLASGPTRYIVEQADGLSWEEARTRLTTALTSYTRPQGVLLPGAQWLVSAVRP
ncbi:methyltransferase domain-containing protein [Actinomadura viridis]|uniref:SAM-dependent methyltransferase n=1 Tax=Actinomadura viridis TaxID=58110 RepID=A0A931DM54_9ACTN|nr:class I SAM-dependent methyltransferase [Actinomadura viridis]MBG6090537.1 SAM-dependent methyltransferase [Actinomadura viridis]